MIEGHVRATRARWKQIGTLGAWQINLWSKQKVTAEKLLGWKE